MDIQKAESIHSLIVRRKSLMDSYDRCEYFRDNYKYVTIKAECDSKRSGHYYLEVDDGTVKDLFNKKLNDLRGEILSLEHKINEQS